MAHVAKRYENETPINNGAPTMDTAIPTGRQIIDEIFTTAVESYFNLSPGAKERAKKLQEATLLKSNATVDWDAPIYPDRIKSFREGVEIMTLKVLEDALAIDRMGKFSGYLIPENMKKYDVLAPSDYIANDVNNGVIIKDKESGDYVLEVPLVANLIEGKGLSDILMRCIKDSGEGQHTVMGISMLKELESEILMRRLITEQYSHMKRREHDEQYRINKPWQAIALQMKLCAEALVSTMPSSKEGFSKHIEYWGNNLFFGGLGYVDRLTNTVVGVDKEPITKIPTTYVFTNIVGADPFIWHERVIDLAIDMELGEHVLGEELLPTDNMLFMFEKPIKIKNPEGQRYIEWMWIWRDEDSTDRINYLWNDKSTTSNKIFKKWISLGEKAQHSLQAKCVLDEDKPLRDQFTEYIYDLTGINVDYLANRPVDDEAYQRYGRSAELNEWLLSPVGQKIHAGYFFINSAYPLPLNALGHELDNAPDEWNSYWLDINDLVIRLLTFLNHDVTDVYAEKLGRSERREQEREDKKRNIKSGEPLVKIIKLRKHKGAPPDPYQRNSSNRKGINYKGAHWVTGHFKQQAYGLGMSLRKLKWIKPYIRGTGEIKSKKRIYVVKE